MEGINIHAKRRREAESSRSAVFQCIVVVFMCTTLLWLIGGLPTQKAMAPRLKRIGQIDTANPNPQIISFSFDDEEWTPYGFHIILTEPMLFPVPFGHNVDMSFNFRLFNKSQGDLLNSKLSTHDFELHYRREYSHPCIHIALKDMEIFNALLANKIYHIEVSNFTSGVITNTIHFAAEIYNSLTMWNRTVR